ncbi:MAG: hypothetical protein WBW71_16065 [Bacteroidota bacterium]
MSLKIRIKDLEKKKNPTDQGPKSHVIIFTPGVDNVDALVAEYRKKDSESFLFVIPRFMRRTELSDMSAQSGNNNDSKQNGSQLGRP